MSPSAAKTSMGPPRGVSVQLGVGAVQVADDALGVGPVGEPAEVGVAGRVERADPGLAPPLGDVEHEPQVVERGADRLVAGEHRPVPGHDRRRAQRRHDVLQHLDRPADRAHEQERRAAVEHEVAAEEHRLLRQPGDHVVGRVRGGADVAQLRAQVAGVHGDAVGEREERRVEGEVAPLAVVPERQLARRPERDDLLARPLVADDRGAREQAVAERVVAVVVGVHEGADRRCRDGLDGVPVGAGAPLGRARVDADDALRPDEEAGVVDPPGAVGLDVGEDAVGDLLRLRPAGLGDRVDEVVTGAHVVASARRGTSGRAGSSVASIAPSSSASRCTRSPAFRYG